MADFTVGIHGRVPQKRRRASVDVVRSRMPSERPWTSGAPNTESDSPEYTNDDVAESPRTLRETVTVKNEKQHYH